LGKINTIGEIIGLGKNIIDEVFMLYQSMNEFQKMLM
jgi:hypothetical protein